MYMYCSFYIVFTIISALRQVMIGRHMYPLNMLYFTKVMIDRYMYMYPLKMLCFRKVMMLKMLNGTLDL